MVLPDDTTLLHEWTARRSETAFRTLVERYAGLVHGTALRHLQRADWAAEAAQDAFVLLARKAPRLSGTALGAWLHRTAIFTASSLLKKETRHARRTHAWAGEQHASSPEVSPAGLSELDAALNDLPGADRALLVLRYFENRTAAQAAAHLGLTTDAAQKRTERALKRLATRLQQRTPGAVPAGLAGALSSQPGPGAPPGFVSAALPHILAATSSTPNVTFLTVFATMKAPHAALLTALLALIPTGYLYVQNTNLKQSLTANKNIAAIAAAEDARMAAAAKQQPPAGAPSAAPAHQEVKWDELGEDTKIPVELSLNTILRSDLPALANYTLFTLSDGVRELLRISDDEAKQVEGSLRACEEEIRKIERSKIKRLEDLPNGVVFEIPAFAAEGKPLREKLFAGVTEAVGERRAAFLLPKIAAATDWRLARFGAMQRRYRVEFQQDQPVIEADGTKRTSEFLTTRIEFQRGDSLDHSQIMEQDGPILAPIAAKTKGIHAIYGEVGTPDGVMLSPELAHLFTVEELRK